MPQPLTPRPTLRDLRLHAGYASFAALAARLGVDRKTYARWERGQHRPGLKQRLKLGRLLHVSDAQMLEVLQWGEEAQ